ncbi:MAG: hypothetical protein AAGB23_05130 [Pseudomonadota bacterium]
MLRHPDDYEIARKVALFLDRLRMGDTNMVEAAMDAHDAIGEWLGREED